jgi:hypothetical protein
MTRWFPVVAWSRGTGLRRVIFIYRCGSEGHERMTRKDLSSSPEIAGKQAILFWLHAVT